MTSFLAPDKQTAVISNVDKNRLESKRRDQRFGLLEQNEACGYINGVEECHTTGSLTMFIEKHTQNQKGYDNDSTKVCAREDIIAQVPYTL